MGIFKNIAKNINKTYIDKPIYCYKMLEKCRIDLNYLLTKPDDVIDEDGFHDRRKAKMFHETKDFEIYGILDYDKVYLVRKSKNNPKEKCFFGKMGKFYCFSRNYIFTVNEDGYDINKTEYYLQAIDIDTGKITLINIRSKYQINSRAIRTEPKEGITSPGTIKINGKEVDIPVCGTVTNKLFSQDRVTGMIYDNRKIIVDIHREKAPEKVPYFSSVFVNEGADRNRSNITTDLRVVISLDYDYKNDKYYDCFNLTSYFPATPIDRNEPGFLIGKWPKKHFVKLNELHDSGYLEFQKGYFVDWESSECHKGDSIYLEDKEVLFESYISRILLNIAPGFDKYDITHISKEKWLNSKINLEEYDVNAREIYKELDEWLKKEVFDKYDCFSIIGI